MQLIPLILAILVFYQHPVLADIVTDGTVGPAKSINTTDGQFIIGQKLGSLKGGNLFHSFRQFDIATNETATFTGDDAIRNVISRVTGGTPSYINGILRSEIGSANFYFINPAGVVFDNNAQVDVPASFHISTAGELIFADESSFNALNPEASTLTIATPEAFGFSSEQDGNLEIIGGQLRFKPGTDVSLSANGLDIQQNARITVERAAGFRLDEQPGLDLNLAAIDSTTTQAIPVADLKSIQATGGELSIENSRIDISGNGAGQLTIRAGPMTVTGSNSDVFVSGLYADNFGAQDVRGTDGIGISIDVDSLDLADALISSTALSDGDSGKIEIKAEQLKISGLLGGISQVGRIKGNNLGKITVIVSGAMQINSKGRISSTNAGIIDVTAEQLTVDGPGSRVTSNANAVGDAGAVKIIAKELMKIQNGGKISSNTDGLGDAGLVRMVTEQLTVDGPGSQISSDTTGEGNAGDVRVMTKELMEIQNGGKISSNTAGTGNAGEVVVDAEQLTVEGSDSQISSDTSGKGNAGNVRVITTELMEIQNGGRISSKTAGPGDAGNIWIESSGIWNRLKNNGQIRADSKKGDVAGNIRITAPVLILDNGQILNKTENVAKKPGGAITIDRQTQIVGAFDFVEKPSSRNVISADSGVVNVAPAPNLAADLVGVIAPNLNIEGINQDPCAQRDENSLKKIGHGGAPAFQHGENYLPINRFDVFAHEPKDIDTLQIMPSINTDHESNTTECDKFQRTSLN